MTCKSCRHSESVPVQSDSLLVCSVTRQPVADVCNRFEYEPGTSPNETSTHWDDWVFGDENKDL